MRRLLLVIVLAIGANAAQADNGLFYFGAGITSNSAESIGVQGIDNSFPKISSTSWQVFAGFRPIKLFAVEADYLDLGGSANTFQSCVTVGSCPIVWKSEAKAFAGYALGFLPIPLPNLDIYGKAGLASYKLNRSITSYGSSGAVYNSYEFPDRSTVFTWGAGVQAHIGIIGGRLEYEGFDKASTTVFSLSVFLNLK
jgi:hypothetical protein